MKTIVIDSVHAIYECKKAFKTTAALDVETTNSNKKRLGDYFSPNFEVVSIQVSFDGETAFVLPLYHQDYKYQMQHAYWEMLYPILDQVNYWIMQNGKFDYKAIKAKYGKEYFPSFDTMGAEYTLDENLKKDLETLAIKYLDAEPWKHMMKSKDPYSMDKNELFDYGALDVLYTYQIAIKQMYLLGSASNKGNHHVSNPLYFDVLMPANRALADMEMLGMPIDMDKFDKRRQETEDMVDQIKYELLQLVGYEVNPRSPKQLGNLLYKELSLPVLESTKSGTPSTAEPVLLRLLDMDSSGVIDKVLEYRHWAGYKSRYFDNWLERMDTKGRLHTNFKPFHTVTGRLSSADPNLQQVPRDEFIRGLIGGVEGHKVIEVDYSQVELRLVAYYSRDRTLLSAFHNKDDIHTITAQALTGKTEPEKEERKKAKAVNFGFVYGMGAEKFKMYARDNFGVKISLKEAKETRQKFFNTYPALTEWHERQRQIVKRRGYVMNPLGRLRRLPEIDSSNEYYRAQAERQAINSPVQSLASDLMLMSLVSLADKYKDQLIGTVHDSLLFLIPNDEVDKAVVDIVKIMENPEIQPYDFELTVPIVADVQVGDYWSEGAITLQS